MSTQPTFAANRDYSYDYLRAFSAIMIICCHIFIGFHINHNVGYFLAGTFVDVFLLLSAYLLGLGSLKILNESPRRFLVKRSAKILPTYYTYLAITFILIVVFIGVSSLNWKQVAGHFLFLNWFWVPARIDTAPLPQLGHLWFMTAIILAYLAVTLWGVAIRKFPFLNSTKGWMVFSLLLAILATACTSKWRPTVYLFTIFLGFELLFFKGKQLMEALRRINHKLLISLLIIGNGGGGIWYCFSEAYNCPAGYFWMNMANAVLWIACAPIIFKPKKPSRAILFISAISFEMYLIHHPFAMGAYSLKSHLPTGWAIAGVFALTLAAAWLLNIITGLIVKYSQRLLRKNKDCKDPGS